MATVNTNMDLNSKDSRLLARSARPSDFDLRCVACSHSVNAVVLLSKKDLPIRSKTLPTAITISGCESYLDGGTIIIGADDGNQRNIEIRLNQPSFDFRFPVFFWIAKRIGSGKSLPGRLLLNGKLVPVRSQIEDRVLRLLTNANIQGKSEAIITKIDRLVKFVRSNEYLTMAATGRIPVGSADETLQKPSTQNHAVNPSRR